VRAPGLILAALLALAYPLEAAMLCFTVGGAALTWAIVNFVLVALEVRKNL